MNKLMSLVVVAALSAGIAYAVATHSATSPSPQQNTQSVYDRVISSGTLRCGYFEEAPFTIVDPNTKQMSGISVDLIERITNDLGLKLEWIPAGSIATIPSDLATGRYDALCASFFTLPRAGQVDYTIPFTYVPVFAYTRAGKTDFDNKLDQQDWSKISIAGIDGEGATTVAQKLLPDAHFVLLPQNAQIADMLTSVADNKADIGFVMPTVFKNFDTNNPGKLQKIVTDKPFYVFNVSYGIKPNEPAFKDILDFMFRNAATNGFLDSLYKKYDPDGLLFRPATMYKPAQP